MCQLLSNICDYINEKIAVNVLSDKNYISTENMLPNKSGIVEASTLPNLQLTQAYQENDILISNIRPYFKKIWQAEYCGGCSNDVLVIRAKRSVNPKFLYYVLSEDKFFDYATLTSKGTKMPRGDKSAIMKYKVPEFSETEQEKIVNILSPIDEKITINNSINNNLEQQAMALYDNIISRNKDSLEERSLSEIANITMGQSPDGSSYNEDGNGTVFYQGRAEFGFRYPTRRLYTTEPKRMAHCNDVLMSVRAPVGDINVAYENCCIGRGLAAIQSTDNTPSFILYTMFNLKKDLNIFNGEGTIFGSINKDSLNSLKLNIPSREEILKFEQTASPLDKLIENNCSENLRLTQLRDTLLPKLMSGEIDVSNVDISADKLSFNEK